MLHAYLIVGLVQIRVTSLTQIGLYRAVLRCAVNLLNSLALPLLRLFRRPRDVAFCPLLLEASKLCRNDSEM